MRYRILSLIAMNSIRGWAILPESWKAWWSEEWLNRYMHRRDRA